MAVPVFHNPINNSSDGAAASFYMFWMVCWTRKMKNPIDAKKFKIITVSDKIIEIFIKKGYNEGIECQLKALAYV